MRHVRHLKTLLGQNYQKRKEDTTPMHSPGCQKCHSHPILHVNVVLQLDLHIPNFEALNLNTSAFFVRLEMSTRTQSFTHLRTCTKDFFKSSFFYTISTNISTHVLTRFVLIAHTNLFGKRLVFLAFLSIFLLFLCGVATASQDGYHIFNQQP